MKNSSRSCQLILLTFAVFLAPSVWAEIHSAVDDCVADLVETTPSSDFTPLGDGAVVRHDPTGLEWRRCPEGMNWNEGRCDGNAETMTWQEGLQNADDLAGWRLPSVNELRSIVERCRTGPAVNRHVFPDTPSVLFWSASPVYGRPENARVINFSTGSDSEPLKGTFHPVRLVRGGQ